MTQANTTQSHSDRILLGILLMLGFCMTAPLLDVSGKLGAESGLPVGQLVTARFMVQGVIMLPVCVIMGYSLRLPKGTFGPVLARSVLLILSTYCFVAATAEMPIADALAIAFVEPFILLILGKYFFGDQVGPRRILASAVGFGGAMLVIQPSFVKFGLVALYPLGTALFFALYMLVTRGLSRKLHPVPMQFQTSIVGLAICLPVMVWADFAHIPTLDPMMPVGWQWAWLIGIGFWAAVSHMMMSYALKFAPSATLAPLHYLEIVAAVFFGFVVFGDLPNTMTWVGIAVIVASGLYVFHRERLAQRATKV